MPQVPDTFVPQVGQAESNTPTVAAPGVQPMQNYAPQQMEAFGQATQRAGQTAMHIANVVQAQLDDANVKAAESKFISLSMDRLHGENGYLNKQGADALNDYDGATQDILKAKQDILDSLSNPVQKKLFNQVSSSHMATFAAQMGRHRSFQRQEYTAGESFARVETARTMAQNADPGSVDQQKYVVMGEQETLNGLEAKGIQRDSDAAQRALRLFRTQITQDNVTRLMTANQYEAAKTLLDAQVKDGNVEPQVADHLRASLQANIERDELITTADKYFAPLSGKQLQTVDLENGMKKIEAEISDPSKREQVENLFKSKFGEQHAIQQAKYRDNLNDVVNFKAEHGTLKGIDPVKWGALNAQDRADLSRPPAVEDNLQTVYDFITKPDSVTVDNVKAAWTKGQLSKGTFLSLTRHAMDQQQSSPDYVQNATDINNRVNWFASQAGMNIYSAKTEDDKKAAATLLFRVQTDINALRAQQKGKATQTQVDEIIKDALTKQTLGGDTWHWYNPFSWGNNGLGTKYRYQMPPGTTGIVKGSDGKMHYTDGKNDLGVAE